MAFIALVVLGKFEFEEIEIKILCDEGRKRKISMTATDDVRGGHSASRHPITDEIPLLPLCQRGLGDFQMGRSPLKR
jgi:hypothetical protein